MNTHFCLKAVSYTHLLRHAGFNNQGICDEVVYAKVRSAALDEEPEEETPEMCIRDRQYAPQHLKDMFHDPDMDYNKIRAYRRKIMEEMCIRDRC